MQLFQILYSRLAIAIFACIICIQLVQCSSSKLKRAAIGPIWPTNKIPYEFNKIEPFTKNQRNKIADAMRLFEDTIAVNGVKCIEFVPRTNETAYLRIVNKEWCYVNFIGYNRDTDKQIMSLNSLFCFKPAAIIHELIHVVGFHHEHARYDRNKYVYVKTFLLNNHNYGITNNSNENNSLNTPYDFQSIMHYPSDTIISFGDGIDRILKNKVNLLGNHKILESDKMSQIDIIQIQRLYNCTESPTQHIDSVSMLEPADLELLKEIFLNETSVDQNIPLERAKLYLNKSLETCGKSHYWPLDHPIEVENHELYKTVCLRKKEENKKCLFSIECKLDLRCLKVPMLKNGVCSNENTSYYDLYKTLLFDYINNL